MPDGNADIRAGESDQVAHDVIIISTALPRWVSDFNAVSDELARAGFAVKIYAPAPSDSAATGWRNAEVIERARHQLTPTAELHFLPYSTNHLTAAQLARTLALAHSLAHANPGALFILWSVMPIVLFGPILRFLGRRVIYMVTGLGSLFSVHNKRRYLRTVAEQVYGRVFSTDLCRIVVHNREDKTFIARHFDLSEERIVVTPGCGVDPAEFPFAADLPRSTPLVILVPARLLIEKGIFDAANASAKLAARGILHEMWFTFCIDQTYAGTLTQQNVDCLVRKIPTVRFIGYQESLIDIYRRCRIVCLPTYYQEGLPTALLEAAAIGRPLVTCDNVGCRDFVRDEIDGLLVPPRSPAQLANALERLIVDQDLTDRLRVSAHKRCLAGFTKRVMLKGMLDAIRDLGFVVP
jgi:glycosyltransferase involved in cell wall biosynthesis